jgi:hypothetical protein
VLVWFAAVFVGLLLDEHLVFLSLSH